LLKKRFGSRAGYPVAWAECLLFTSANRQHPLRSGPVAWYALGAIVWVFVQNANATWQI